MKKKTTQKKLRDKLAVSLQTLQDLDLQSVAAGSCLPAPPTCDASTSSVIFPDY